MFTYIKYSTLSLATPKYIILTDFFNDFSISCVHRYEYIILSLILQHSINTPVNASSIKLKFTTDFICFTESV